MNTKSSTKLIIYTSRINNKILPNHHLLSKEQKEFWERNIFNENNMISVFNSMNSKSLKSSSLHVCNNKESIITNIVASNITSNITVMKYHESTNTFIELSIDEILQYVKLKFSKKISYYKKKIQLTGHHGKKKNQNSSLLEKETSNSNFPTQDIQLKVFKKKKYCPTVIYKNIPYVEKFYSLKKFDNVFSNESWNSYSMVHNLYEPLEFIVYNGSHKLHIGEVIHRNTRVVIKIPENRNCMILFHANLMHSYAQSKFEPQQYSMNYAKDLCALAHIFKHSQDILETNSNFIHDNVEDNLNANNHVNGNECIGCRKMSNVSLSCEICNEFSINEFMTSEGFVIDLSTILSDPKSSRNNISPIIGDICTNGWAVYVGVDCKNLDLVKDLFQGCRDLLYNDIRNVNWKQIQQPLHKNGARNMLKFDKSFFKHNIKNLKKPLSTVSNFFKLVESNCLRNIPGFETSIISEACLVHNDGYVPEQLPQRSHNM